MGDAALLVSVALASVYLPADLIKIAVPANRLIANPRLGWAAAVSDPMVKAIGVPAAWGLAAGLV